jgi:UDPglucose 6-dehydrogenase|tara:strand:- start:525 stop:1274 length:750 start_codon:yes stop_codon:yes gene_type:complete
MNKIGIAGYGFVGQAHHEALKEYYDIIIFDPAKGHYGNLDYADSIIVCVSTPEAEDGSCDMRNVYDVVRDAPHVPILIKSTISLEGWKKLREESQSLTFSPEFLRAKTALEDFRNIQTLLIGGDDVNLWSGIFLQALGNINVTVSTPEELILTKYVRNTFLATKVAFFNEIYDLCEAANIDYTKVAELVIEDDRIGSSHTEVTKERGYGGHCFPKDVNAILKTAALFKNNLNILESAKNYNTSIRKDAK